MERLLTEVFLAPEECVHEQVAEQTVAFLVPHIPERAAADVSMRLKEELSWWELLRHTERAAGNAVEIRWHLRPFAHEAR